MSTASKSDRNLAAYLPQPTCQLNAGITMKLAAVKLAGFFYMAIVIGANFLTMNESKLQLAVLGHNDGHSMEIGIPELWQDEKEDEGEKDSVSDERVILTDGLLRTACLTGSFMGAFMAICIWPSDGSKDFATQLRVLGVKFLASGIAGVMLTPILVRWANLTIDSDWLVGAAGAVSFMSVAVLHKIAPTLLTAAVSAIEGLVSVFRGKIPGPRNGAGE